MDLYKKFWNLDKKLMRIFIFKQKNLFISLRYLKLAINKAKKKVKRNKNKKIVFKKKIIKLKNRTIERPLWKKVITKL